MVQTHSSWCGEFAIKIGTAGSAMSSSSSSSLPLVSLLCVAAAAVVVIIYSPKKCTNTFLEYRTHLTCF